MSKREVEELLKRGAYDFFRDSKLSDESSAVFMDASIDEILAANTTLVVEEKTARSDGKSNSFASAAFEPGSSSKVAASSATNNEGEAIKQSAAGRKIDSVVDGDRTIDLNAQDFWQSLGLRANQGAGHDLDKLDDCDAHAATTTRNVLRQRRGKKKVDYTDNGVPIIFGGTERFDGSDAEYSDAEDPQWKSRQGTTRVWTSKELEAVFCGVKLYGISRWPTIAHEVFEATLTDKGWGGNGDEVSAKEGAPKWTEAEVREMGCWMILKCMLIMSTQKKQSATSRSSGGALSSCSAVEMEATTQGSDAPTLLRGLSSSTVSDVDAVTDNAKSRKPTERSNTVVTMESLLIDHPSCQEVLRTLCAIIDDKVIVTSDSKKGAKVAEAAVRAEESPTPQEAIATPGCSGALTRQATFMFAQMDTQSGQRFSPGSKVPPGSEDEDAFRESFARQVFSTLSAADMGQILGRYMPAILANRTSSKFCAGLSENVAKRAIKSIDELWWIHGLSSLLGYPEGSRVASFEEKCGVDNASAPVATNSGEGDAGTLLAGLNFADISGAVRIKKKAPWWGVAHDAALVRAALVYGNPSNAKRYEAMCFDQGGGCANPLILEKNKSTDPNQPFGCDSGKREVSCATPLEAAQLLTKRDIQRRIQALVKSAKGLLEKNKKSATKAAVTTKTEKEARTWDTKNTKRKGSRAATAESLKKFCEPIDSSWATSLKSAFPNRPSFFRSSTPNTTCVSNTSVAVANTSDSFSSLGDSAETALDILRSRRLNRREKQQPLPDVPIATPHNGTFSNISAPFQLEDHEPSTMQKAAFINDATASKTI